MFLNLLFQALLVDLAAKIFRVKIGSCHADELIEECRRVAEESRAELGLARPSEDGNR